MPQAAQTSHRPPHSGLRIGAPNTTSTTSTPALLPARGVPQRGSPAAHQLWSQGVAQSRQGRLAQAAGHFERATKMAPGVPLYWMNLASVQRKLQRTEAAMDSARRCFALDGSSEIGCHLLAELLRLNNRDAEALQVLTALDPATPRSGRHWLLQGSVLMALQQWQDAAIAFLKVLAGKPGDIESYMQLGFALANLRRYGEAGECFRTVSMLEPTHFGGAIYAAHYAAWACDWVQGGDDLVRLAQSLALQHEGAEIAGFSPFCMLSMNDDAAMHRRVAEMEGRRIAATAGAPGVRYSRWPQAEAALAQGRLRVGFVSADFRVHATSMLLVQTLERLPRERFEVFLYAHGNDDGSALRQRVVASADHFVDCNELNADEQAARIHDDGVTLLVDLSGYTASSRLGVFARRPAPVQVLWLAYPSTIGGDFIDYIVGDPILTPLDHAADFSEQIAQLPLCYEPTDERREHPEPLARADCGLPEDRFVFACFNQSYKITEPVFSRWCRILQRVPGSVLWLLVPQEEIQRALHARAAERGIDASRVIFAPFVSPEQHLARLPQADLFLDTFPYGAHTTCSDALWMGLPVLTQLGRSFSARVAASLLNAVGLPEMAVDSEADYEERAVALATVPGELQRMRDHLWDNRRDLPLFDNERFTGEIAALFERMAGRWQQGLPPAPLAAA
jgi:predicted O-linked N-acetylglucosamine transferase (SPINDLY family)